MLWLQLHFPARPLLCLSALSPPASPLPSPRLCLRNKELLWFLHAAQERDTDLYRPFPALPAEPSFLGAPQAFLPEPRTWSVGHLANSWEVTSLDSDTSLLSSPCLWPAWQAGARIFCALCSEVRVGGCGKTAAANGNHLGVPQEFLRPNSSFPLLPASVSGAPPMRLAASCPARTSAGHLSPSAHGALTRPAMWCGGGCAGCLSLLGRAPEAGHTVSSTASNAAFRRRHTPDGLVRSGSEL